MFNLIRMNLYRMVRSTSLWSIMLVLVATCAFSGCMQVVFLDGNTFGDGYADSSIGMSLLTALPESMRGSNPSFPEIFSSDLSSGILLIFLSVACAIFYGEEIKSGFLKNITGQTRDKTDIFWSKLIATMLLTLWLILLWGITKFIILKLLWPKEFTIPFVSECQTAIPFLLMGNFILHLAFAGGIVLITMLSKSSAVGSIIGILFPLGLPAVFLGMVEESYNVELVKYLIPTGVHHMRIATIYNEWIGYSEKDIYLALGTGIVFFILYEVLGAVYFTRKDVD